MREPEDTVGFSWDFLDEMVRWTLSIAAIVAVVGLVVRRDPSFALGCLLGAIGDVAIVHAAVVSAKSALKERRFDGSSGALLLGGRVLFKGALLAIAVFLPNVLDFFGTVVGVLAYDVTLAVVGSIVALRRGLRDFSESR